MAILNLNRVWINLEATGAAVSAPSDPARDRNHGIDLEIGTYGGGRQAATTAEGEATAIGRTLIMVTEVTVTTLRLWAGELVQYRDHRGLRFFGAYDTLAVREYKTPTLYAVTFTLKTLSYEEGA